MQNKKYNIAIVGATGAVGLELLGLMTERNFPVSNLLLLASSRSAGKCLEFQGRKIVVQELNEKLFRNIDIAFFSAGSQRSLDYASIAAQNGVVVIDNSSAYRMDEDVPLVIPEINPREVALYNRKNIIANPNCTTAVMLMGIKPIHDLSGIKRIVATSFQAVSGAGAQAIDELSDQTRKWANSDKITSSIFPHQIAFNLIPHIDKFTGNGYTKEEMKLLNETQKILNDNNIMVTATTVRVPVFRSHCISVNVETESKVELTRVIEAYKSFPGLRVVDNPDKSLYPMPIESSGIDDCLIGRIREDYTIENGINFWISGDQLRKGAALNAIQIAEVLITNYV